MVVPIRISLSITWEPKSFCFVVSFRYSWTFSEVEEVQGASLLVAADVIYSDDLTDAFFNVLEKFMSLGSEKVQIKMIEQGCNSKQLISPHDRTVRICPLFVLKHKIC